MPFNVLSLCDGISCGQIALNRAGIKYDKYFASEIDKNAIKVTQSNYPATIQIGSITEVKACNLPKIDLILSGTPCFVADTLILTRKGYKEIKDVAVGDMVLTHLGNWRKVLNIGHKDDVPTRLIKGYGNIGTETTDEHPFYCRTRYFFSSKRKRIKAFTEPRWQSAAGIAKPDYCGMVAIPLNKRRKKTDIFWYMMGRYTGDGWCCNSRRTDRKNSFLYQFIICCGKHEVAELEAKFQEFGFKYTIVQERTVYKISIYSKKLVRFALKIGKGASNKVIHPSLLNSSQGEIIAYLSGYFDSDGNYRKRCDSYRAASTSRKLVMGIQQLIVAAYNRPVSMEFYRREPTCVIEGRVVNQKHTYTVSYKKDARKQDKAFFRDNIAWVPVVSNNKTGESKRVYNLEVETDNSYTANNIIVHNCKGFSSAGQGTNFDHPETKLFFDFVRVLNEARLINPDVKFLFENVRMKQEHQDKISELLGVQPVKINSALVSAQNRVRLYWSNIAGIVQPADRGIKLRDIINEDYDGIWVWPRGGNSGGVQGYKGKSPSLTTSSWQHNFLIYKGAALRTWPRQPTGQKREKRAETRKDDKANCLTTHPLDSLVAAGDCEIRKFTPEEAEKLQTVPPNYTVSLSANQRYKCLGNGWTVDVIAHILENIKTLDGN